MNRKQRRLKEKEDKKKLKTNPFHPSEMEALDGASYWTYTGSKNQPEEAKEIEIPGINVPPFNPEFAAMVESNIWHDRSELDEFIGVIQKLSKDEDGPLIQPISEPSLEDRWSWAYNHKCKYVNIRVDMRDGAFTFTNSEGERINLDQLKWQWKSINNQ